MELLIDLKVQGSVLHHHPHWITVVFEWVAAAVDVAAIISYFLEQELAAVEEHEDQMG